MPKSISLVTSLAVLALAMLPAMGLASDPTFTQTCFSSNLAGVMAIADFNNDGKLDVALQPDFQDIPFILATDFLDVYLGNGDGTFASPIETEPGFTFNYATGDLNNDGKLDLVLGGSPLKILPGNGDGTFGAVQTLNAGDAFDVKIVDLNGDGVVDLAVTDSKAVSVLLGKGNGAFKDKVKYRTGDSNTALATADFNGDGVPDLATVYAGLDHVAVLLNNGAGKFSKYVETPLGPLDSFHRLRELGAADLNGDNMADLVVPAQGGNGVYVMLGHGDGTFEPTVTYPMPGDTRHVDFGDLNGDGKVDIVAGNYLINDPSPGGSVTVLYGNGAGGFVSSGAVANVAFGFEVQVANINTGDSRPDIVADGCVLLNDGASPMAARLATPPAEAARTGIVGSGRRSQTYGLTGSQATDLSMGSLDADVRRMPARSATSTSAQTTAGGPKGTGVSAMGVAPNPLRQRGLLSFTLAKAGPVSVRLFDTSGRLMRTVKQGQWAEPGRQEVRIDRLGLRPGIYLVRIDTVAGTASGRLVVMD